jgi:HAE1 family hydrophobic/amphiphilic exporter-1
VPPDQSFQFTLNALGRLSDASQFEDIIIKTASGSAPQIVRLRDVARVDLSQQYFSNFANVGGLDSAQILVFALPGANAIAVADRVFA